MFQEFFFSHFTLIATNFEQLREKIEESLWCNRQSQPDMIAKAYSVFVEDVMAFYCAQKIKVHFIIDVHMEMHVQNRCMYMYIDMMFLYV